jgi:predicted enzyme related to lactoylglutathione lyase
LPTAIFFIKRASNFYTSILGSPLQQMEAMDMKSAFFPADLENGSIGGYLIQGPGYTPTDQGALVYLNGGNDLKAILNKVEKAGRQILLNKTAIEHNGYMAHFKDAEENKIGLHSRN